MGLFYCDLYWERRRTGSCKEMKEIIASRHQEINSSKAKYSWETDSEEVV